MFKGVQDKTTALLSACRPTSTVDLPALRSALRCMASASECELSQ